MNTDIEHESLRQEIMESGSHAINAANIVVTITGIALVAAFEFQIPIVALLPLAPLYYSYKIAFNSTQTIARSGAYLKVIENERYETYLSHLRLLTYMKEEQRKRETWRVQRFVAPRSLLHEVWISSILQRLFIWLGVFCIGGAAFAAVSVWGTPTTVFSAGQLLGVAWCIPFSVGAVGTGIGIAIASFWWLVFALRQQPSSGDPLYGPTSMMQQFEKEWMEVKSKYTQQQEQSAQPQQPSEDFSAE